MEWNILADEEVLQKTVAALNKRGIETIIVNNAEEARKKVFELIPEGAEVMNVTSTTLDQIGVSKEIENGNYKSLKKMIMAEKDDAKRNILRKEAGSPEYGIGSVHAITEYREAEASCQSTHSVQLILYGL
jgi:6-phosphogluconolactonase/glucosamine-6-phosphate isomerase/deaminase